MSTPTKFRIISGHLFGALAGIYVATAISRVFAWISPEAPRIALIVLASFIIVSELCMTVRELHRGRLSTGIIILDFMPLLLIGGGFSLLLGGIATRWFGSEWGGYIVFFGVYYCIIVVICGVKYRVQERNLQEDLEHPRAIDAEEDARQHRKYMNPYI